MRGADFNKDALDQCDLQPSSKRKGGLLERRQRRRVTVGIQQPIYSRATSVHPPGHFGLRQLLFCHQSFNLKSQYTLSVAVVQSEPQ